MARMYAKRKGKSGSTKPHNESLPEWANTDAKAVTELILELGKAGHSSASIGTILRDQHAFLMLAELLVRESLRFWQRITLVVLTQRT